MAPSHKLAILAVLTAALACDLGAHALATPPAPAVLAAAQADAPSLAERKARRAARRAKADAATNAGKLATPSPTTAHPQPVRRPPATPAPTTAAAPGLPACPPDNVLTHRSFGDGFLRTWCTGCHSSTLAASARQDAPADVNFDRADLYKPHARAVYDRAVIEAHAIAVDPTAAAAPMPPAGVVPEADRRRLAQWIACGSPGA